MSKARDPPLKNRAYVGRCGYSSVLTYLCFSSSMRLMKSVFSRHPSHSSSQSERIFFRSRTFSFFRSTAFTSICLSAIETGARNGEWSRFVAKVGLIPTITRCSYRIANHRFERPSSWASRRSFRPAWTSWSVWTAHPRYRWQNLRHRQGSSTAWMRGASEEKRWEYNYTRSARDHSTGQLLTKRCSLFLDFLQNARNSSSIRLVSFFVSSDSVSINVFTVFTQTGMGSTWEAEGWTTIGNVRIREIVLFCNTRLVEDDNSYLHNHLPAGRYCVGAGTGSDKPCPAALIGRLETCVRPFCS